MAELRRSDVCETAKVEAVDFHAIWRKIGKLKLLFVFFCLVGFRLDGSTKHLVVQMKC